MAAAAHGIRPITPELVRAVVDGFGHGALDGFDPASEIGSQRESHASLGFGWLYVALARVLQPSRVLVIGSGRGFTAACFALGIEHLPGSRVVLVDPGYASWPVDGDSTDTAPGVWQDPEAAKARFGEILGLDNVDVLRVTSDDAFALFAADGPRFDMVLIDGDHGYEQMLADLRNAESALGVRGTILAHDCYCAMWPGVALAIEQFVLEHPEFQQICLPLYPGLALIQRSAPILAVRLATHAENETINVWRAAAGVTERPLPEGDDPRPGTPTDNACEGLHAILEDGELIGGLGIRWREFSREGHDDFPPADGQPLSGFLIYGVVLRPESRGQGRFRRVMVEVLKQVPGQVAYVLAGEDLSGTQGPHRFIEVGRTSHHTAFRAELAGAFALDGASGLARRLGEAVRDLSDKCDGLSAKVDELENECDAQRERARIAEETVGAMTRSRSWRLTAPLRAVMDLARRLEGR